MQTLERLRFAADVGFDALRYRLDSYLARIQSVVNHNALDSEWLWTMEVPANGIYVACVPNAARKVIGVGFVLQAGTCTVTVSQGAQTISWTAAGGTGLSATTTTQTDSAASSNVFVSDDAIKIAVSSVSGAAGLAVSLRTGA